MITYATGCLVPLWHELDIFDGSLGVGRNDASYVRARQITFASVFHRNAVAKYALINLYDRHFSSVLDCF